VSEVWEEEEGRRRWEGELEWATKVAGRAGRGGFLQHRSAWCTEVWIENGGRREEFEFTTLDWQGVEGREDGEIEQANPGVGSVAGLLGLGNGDTTKSTRDRSLKLTQASTREEIAFCFSKWECSLF